MNAQVQALSQVEIEQRSFITKVYGWMAFALLAMVVVLAVRPEGLFGTVFEEERL